jgi:hypothetical protein
MAIMTLGTGNRGNHAGEASIKAFLEGLDIASLMEMHSEDETRSALRASSKYGIFSGTREDAEADCVVWRHETIKIHTRKSIPLLPADKRDGKFNMQKSLNIVLAEHKPSGYEFWFGACHQIQTVYTKNRLPAAKLFVHRIDEFAHPLLRPVFIPADWNAIWPHEVMDEFRRGDWRTDATLKPGLNTFGNRNIDYFIWRNLGKGAKVTTAWTENIEGSDHNGKKIKVNLP